MNPGHSRRTVLMAGHHDVSEPVSRPRIPSPHFGAEAGGNCRERIEVGNSEVKDLLRERDIA